MMDYPLHWKHSVQLIWDVQELTQGIDEQFQKYGVKRVLDAACGTGEITVELAKLGYEIDCSDTDPNMIAATKELAKQEGVELSLVVCAWSDLTKCFSEPYDAVMIRGNSFPYVFSWSELGEFTVDKEKANEELFKSFNSVNKLLKPRGIFYYDMRSTEEKQGIEVAGKGIIGGKPSKLVFDITYEKDVRKVISHLTIGNETKIRQYSGYLLSFDVLDKLIRDAKFKPAQIKIKGENAYTPFFALKII